MSKTSKVSGLYKMNVCDRQKIIKDYSGIDELDLEILNDGNALTMDKADKMVENVIGRIQLPVGVAANFIVNGNEYFIPMATEEPSVIAAASNAAKWVRNSGGIFASDTGSHMIAQMQIVELYNPNYAMSVLYEKKQEIIDFANEQDPVLVGLGGGACDIDLRIIRTRLGNMLILHLVVDTKDAMGANAVNTMAESLKPMVEELTGGKIFLKILSNLADKRLVRARAVASKEDIGGEDIVDSIIYASEFANNDPYRAATHNKGIMNGISAVVCATGNDTRAIEAGAHSFAAKGGQYSTLSKWEKNKNGDLTGMIELPVAVGTVGGATASHPVAQTSLKILGVESALELGHIIAAVGLIQNLAALRALATEGIQRGHMSLHAKNIAISAGAKGDEIDKVVAQMIEMKKIRVDVAEEILNKLNK